MKKLLLSLSLIATSACSQSSDVNTVSPSGENGWTPQTTAATLNTCKTMAVDSGNTQAYADSYCSCIYDTVIPRWGYSDLEHNEPAIIEALAKEGTIAQCLQVAGQPEIEAISKAASMVGMPDGFFGIRIGTAVDELRAKKPRARQESWGFVDTESLGGEAFNVTYMVTPVANTVPSISLERESSLDSYMATNAYLNDQFGPLSTPSKHGHWLLRSERVTGGIELIHVLTIEGPGTTKEKIMLSHVEK